MSEAAVVGRYLSAWGRIFPDIPMDAPTPRVFSELQGSTPNANVWCTETQFSLMKAFHHMKKMMF